MNKKILIGIYAASLGLFLLVLLIIVGVLASGVVTNKYGIQPAISFGLSFGVLAYLQFLAVHTILNFLMLYRMWGAIQDGQTEITVGKAIGFLFIPIFNVYWIFRTWGSFPTEYNKYLERCGLPAPRLSGGVFVTYPILILLSGLLLPLLILPFVFMVIISKACNAVNAVSSAVRQGQNAAIRPAPMPQSQMSASYR